MHKEFEEKIIKCINSMKNAELDLAEKDGYTILPFFRSALTCYNKIYTLNDEVKEQHIKEEMKNIVIDKVIELEPSFNTKVLEKILHNYKRGAIYMPLDIFVADNNVFFKDGELDDWGNIYKQRNHLVTDSSEFEYKEINGIHFTENCWKSDFEDFFHTLNYDNDKCMEVSKLISDAINKTLFEEIGMNVVAPLYKLNTDERFYGYRGITYNVSNIQIYMNCNFNQVYDLIEAKKDATIKMIFQSGDYIEFYDFYQTFENDQPTWKSAKKDVEIWKMTEAIQKRNSESNKKDLVKNPNN